MQWQIDNCEWSLDGILADHPGWVLHETRKSPRPKETEYIFRRA